MKVTEAEFIKSAFEPGQYPPETMPEVAFAGKSNVGKSSLINRLVNRKKLARTSSSPGRTQSINFFSINQKLFFVDLPGYGYAKVPRDVQGRWKPMVESYLRTRDNLRLVVVILDVRREVGNDDRALLDWLAYFNIESLVVLTKIDKVSKSQCAHRRAAIKRAVGLQDEQIVLFSAQTGEGKDKLWKKLSSALVQT